MNRTNIRRHTNMVSELEQIKSRESVVELIRLYKSFPNLWDSSHTYYWSTFERRKAYEILLEKYKKFDKTANLIDMKKKIQLLKQSVKREKNKMQAMFLEVGHCGDYEPSLWYYPYLNFLYPFEGERKVPSPDFFYYGKVRREMEAELKKNSTSEKQASPERDPAELEALEKYSAEAFGLAISYQINALSKLQRFVAEKLIQDILCYAKSEKLNLDTVLYLENNL